MFKKWDIVIIVFLVIVSFLPEVVFGMVLNKEYNMTYAEVTVGGEFHSKIPLSAHSGEDIITIEVKENINKILVKDDTVEVLEANCPDEYCIKDGQISEVGESLVCLPNKVMVEIKGDIKDKDSEDDIINSH